jgi:hypothetical protein
MQFFKIGFCQTLFLQEASRYTLLSTCRHVITREGEVWLSLH